MVTIKNYNKTESHLQSFRFWRWLSALRPFLWTGPDDAGPRIISTDCSITEADSGYSAVQSWTVPAWTEMPAEECCSS